MTTRTGSGPRGTGPEDRFISTGHLPGVTRVDEVLTRCHAEFSAVTQGALSAVYPALTRADPGLFPADLGRTRLVIGKRASQSRLAAMRRG